jgi:hypothetical protein
VKISETDNSQQKPTENRCLSSLFSVDDCWCLQAEGPIRFLCLQAAFADITIAERLVRRMSTTLMAAREAMLTIPIFRPWRPIWDAQLADATRRLDELAKERQKGRQTPPLVHDWSDVQRVVLAAHLAEGRVSSIKFMQEKIEPLLKACVWPRWLLLEAALDHAANLGDLHLSALILRSQIEELDALRTVATVLSTSSPGILYQI